MKADYAMMFCWSWKVRFEWILRYQFMIMDDGSVIQRSEKDFSLLLWNIMNGENLYEPNLKVFILAMFEKLLWFFDCFAFRLRRKQNREGSLQ